MLYPCRRPRQRSSRRLVHILMTSLALAPLYACSTAGGARASGDDGARDARKLARIQQDAQSLIDRRAILNREFERTTSELDTWSKRYKIGVATPRLVLSLLSRNFKAHHVSDQQHSGFEREYAAIEAAMTRIANERAAIERDTAELKAQLSTLEKDPDPVTTTQSYHFGDVFLPIAGVEQAAQRAACEELTWGKRLSICELVEEHCSARNPERPSEGWLQFCVYSCTELRPGTILLGATQ